MTPSEFEWTTLYTPTTNEPCVDLVTVGDKQGAVFLMTTIPAWRIYRPLGMGQPETFAEAQAESVETAKTAVETWFREHQTAGG